MSEPLYHIVFDTGSLHGRWLPFVPVIGMYFDSSIITTDDPPNYWKVIGLMYDGADIYVKVEPHDEW